MSAKVLTATVCAALLAGGLVYYGQNDKSVPIQSGIEEVVAETDNGSITLAEEPTSELAEPKADLNDILDTVENSLNADTETLEKPASKGRISMSEKHGAKHHTELSDVPPRVDKTKPKVKKPKLLNGGDAAAKSTFVIKEEKPKAAPSATKVEPAAKQKTPLDRIIDISMPEIAKTQDPVLRDRAYASLAELAIEDKDYDRARDILGYIQDDQSRDASRSHVALGLAKDGRVEAAFEAVDAIQGADLKDVVRLQIIEAISLKD